MTGRRAPHVAIVWLLVASVFINYIDRTNLSIAAPLLKNELHLSGTQLGFIFSAFFYTYACFQLVSGWLADRIDVKWLLAGGFGLWSLATATTGFVHGFAALLVARFVLGVGESVAYPSYSRILVEHFPEDRRGWPNAAISAGFSFGIAFGMLVGGVLVARTGWRPFFVGLGALSLLWLIPWLRLMPRSERGENLQTHDSPAAWQIARQRSFLGTCLGLFAANYFSYSLLTWLPLYLVDERHLSMDRMAVTGGAIYIVVALSSLALGWVADHRIATGVSTPGIRRTISASGLVIAGISLFAAVSIAESGWSVGLLIGAGFGFGVFSSSHWAATQTLAGPLASGRWTGMQNFTGNLAGIIAPMVAGIVLDYTGHYYWAFTIAAVITLIGAASWTFVVQEVREVDWRAAPSPPLPS